MGIIIGIRERMFRMLRPRGLVGPHLPLNSISGTFVSLEEYSAITLSYVALASLLCGSPSHRVLVMNSLWIRRHAHDVDVTHPLQRMEHLQGCTSHVV